MNLWRAFQQAVAEHFAAGTATRIQKILKRTDTNLQGEITAFAAKHQDLRLNPVPQFENGAVVYRAPDFTLEITPISGMRSRNLSRLSQETRSHLAAQAAYEGGLSVQLVRPIEGEPTFHQTAFLYPTGHTRSSMGDSNYIALYSLLRLIPQRNDPSLRLHDPVNPRVA